MTSYIPVELREHVRDAATGRCAYCQSREALMGVTFEIDHIIPQSAAGATSLDNLCLSCPTCNRRKAGRLTATDPETGEEVTLFHPQEQRWSDYFAWSQDGTRILSLTPIGRATIAALHMNRPVIVQLRRYWITLGLHPPEPER